MLYTACMILALVPWHLNVTSGGCALGPFAIQLYKKIKIMKL